MAAAALSPATTSLRLKPFSAIHLLSLYRKTTKTPAVPNSYLCFLPKPPTHSIPSHSVCRRRSFCSVVCSAVSSGEAVERPLSGDFGTKEVEGSRKIGEFRRRLRIADIKGGPDEGLDRLGETLVVRGWVRTLRVQSSVTFIEVNDGSCLSNMQCVVSQDAEGYDQVENGLIITGASVWIQGTIASSQGSKQKIELKVEKLVLVGKSDPSFPIQKKRVTREFLRTKAHLRPRTNTFGAVARVRNALAFATHKFFQENGFVWVSSPIVTASDCEGAGEQFCVTTLIPTSKEPTNSPVNEIPKTESGSVDWSQDFFGKPAFLTVSGQLNAETYATALNDVYTFGPTFRAENSNTSRHLAEFWMIEPELAFADLEDDMSCAAAYLQYVDVVEKKVVQLTYTDAIELLLKTKKKFEFPDIKAFYMRENDDGKTVAAMDMLVPRVGELIGGSQREERLEYLEKRLDDLNLNKETYWWYLDLRRYGSVPHAGFGLGFERLVQFATGIDNIRDAIPFPRTPGSAEF
nr:asparagine--tRNA ligase, chloroplastic/mitochondrial-like [Ipomoea batatas]